MVLWVPEVTINYSSILYNTKKKTDSNLRINYVWEENTNSDSYSKLSLFKIKVLKTLLGFKILYSPTL